MNKPRIAKGREFILNPHVTTSKTDTPVALTIATSDSGGGAGIQADLKTFTSRGVYGTSVLCALTAQNPEKVSNIAELEPDFIRAQLDAVFNYFDVGALKTGMLFSAQNIHLIADYLASRPGIPFVLDPVMVATSGSVLLQDEAITALKTKLLPAATVITPNLDEAEVLLGNRPTHSGEMEDAARHLYEAFGTAVLLKGGHLEDSNTLVDVLCDEDGIQEFSHERIQNINTHGSGCTLAAAITAELAKGHSLRPAVSSALTYLHSTLLNPSTLRGEQFIRH